MAKHLKNITVIVPPISSFNRGVLHGLSAFLMQASQDWSVYMDYDPRIRKPQLNGWEGDGIITSYHRSEIVESLTNKSIPVVNVGAGGYTPIDDDIPYAYVGLDHRHISRLTFEHLYNLGLRRFAYVGAPASYNSTWSDCRGQAFREYAEEAGCSCEQFSVSLNTRLASRPKTLKKLQQQLESLPHPMGLMASCDRRGRLLLDALRGMDARVPEDYAVVGVDNDFILCNLSLPPLTSVSLNTYRIGYLAAELLYNMMSGERLTNQYYSIEPLGVEARRSTNMLAIADGDLADAISFVRDHACDPIQVGDVLAKIPLSRSTLECRFKEHLGRSIHAEIRRVQIERAKNLLIESDLSVSVIAKRCGIQTVEYFSKIVHQETGFPPAQFRSRNQSIASFRYAI
ncbi:MAG: DNA-binding transcriptional regulator [Pirellulales bacterium]